jgi:hypothetical protein
MLTVSLAQLKSDIAGKMKGTSIREVKDFYGTAASAANRMLSRIDTEETRRTATLATPFWDNVNDYVLATDYKGMIDIRPTANRQDQPGLSHYGQRTPRQFNERLDANSFSIRWNNMIRTLRAQRLPSGNVVTLDTLTTPTSNGEWKAFIDIPIMWDMTINWDQALNWDNGLFTSPINFVQGQGSLGFNLDGSTGSAHIENTTASSLDLTEYNFQDTSMLFFYIPSGFASRFQSFKLRRGSSASNYVEVTITTKADGTAFTDGWNFLLFTWDKGTVTGTPDDTNNTYRYFGLTYTSGTYIKGCYLNAWTDSLGELYETEYYSEYLFRTAAGVWIQTPTVDTDLVNVSPASYEILKVEMMIEITKQIRTGSIQEAELTDWRLFLNGQPQTRYVKDPPYHGLYSDYLSQYPSSRIVTQTRTYDFDV